MLLLSLLLSVAQAAPKELEVWFLTPPKSATLERWLLPPSARRTQLALACEPMGDYCFDPQVGLYKKQDAGGPEFVDPSDVKLDAELPHLPTATSVDRSLISCDSKNAFDMFCGQARPEAKAKAEGVNFEIWIDTSSSMREMDWADPQGHCQREAFVKRLDELCGFQKKVSVMMYDVSLREMGTIASACQSTGQNDTKRLMDWIERATAKKLIVITDVNEYTKEFGDFIEARHGKVRGDRGSFTAKDIVALADGLKSSCK